GAAAHAGGRARRPGGGGAHRAAARGARGGRRRARARDRASRGCGVAGRQRALFCTASAWPSAHKSRFHTPWEVCHWRDDLDWLWQTRPVAVRRIMPYRESPDFKATRAFYTRVLGLEEGTFGGGYIGFGSGQAQVVFAPPGVEP